MKWIRENYIEVNQKVVNIFVKMYRFHQEQKTITSRVKPVKQPLQAQKFLSLLEIDLMDFRNCSCACTAQQHKWAINFVDHHTKFAHVFPLHSKSGKDVEEEEEEEESWMRGQQTCPLYNTFLTCEQ